LVSKQDSLLWRSREDPPNFCLQDTTGQVATSTSTSTTTTTRSWDEVPEGATEEACVKSPANPSIGQDGDPRGGGQGQGQVHLF